MATCQKCGNQFYSKECPYCKEIEWKKNNNIKTTKTKSKTIAATIMTTIILIVVGTIIYKMNSNPLIGTWKSNKNIMGMGKIEFKEDKMIFMGIVSKVQYEKDGDDITVIDDTGTGMIYKIIDDDTIQNEIMGFRTIYKRVN